MTGYVLHKCINVLYKWCCSRHCCAVNVTMNECSNQDLKKKKEVQVGNSVSSPDIMLGVKGGGGWKGSSTLVVKSQHTCWYPGLGCMITSQTDLPPRLHLLSANWRPWHLKWKLTLSRKGGLHSRSCHIIWDVSASGLSCTRLADCLPPWQ